MTGWFAGAAAVEVPVEAGTPLAGYAAREGPATGTLDPLTVGAVVLSAGDQRLAIIALDLIAVDFSMVREVSDRVGLPLESIAMCASHTHSGPLGVTERLHPAEPGRVDSTQRDRFIAAAVDAVLRSLDRLEPATVSFGEAECEGVAANRLDPDGLNDPTVSIIRVDALAGNPVATLVHLALHPTIFPAESRVVSADFPGALRRSLPASRFGTVLYLNGAAGDISTRFTRRAQDASEVDRIGGEIAGAVANESNLRSVPASLSSRRIAFDLPFRTANEMGSAASHAHSASLSALAGDRVELTRLQGLAILERMLATSDIDHLELDVGIWDVGDIQLIGFPGELFCALGERLEAGTADRIVVGYANGYGGYFPDRRAYETGTYEALASPWSSETVEAMIESIRRNL